MTLLVLGISPPRPQDSLAQSVLPGMIESLVPQVFLFIVAFLVRALFWLGHHRQFHFVRKIDPVLLWINILILIAIVFVPFSTDLAGDYPAVTDATLLFHANMFIVGILSHLDARLTAAYQTFVKSKNLSELRALLGPRKDLGNGQ